MAVFRQGRLATKAELDLCDALELPVKSLMYQSGYLTIKGVSKTEVDEIGNPKLILGAPNHEVRGALKTGVRANVRPTVTLRMIAVITVLVVALQIRVL